jgi:uncharacterized protein (TIGR03083 family)
MIETAHLFAPLNDDLVTLLRALSDDDWRKPTVAGAWTVRDVAAHLLDTSIRRLAMHRDAYEPPLPPDAFARGIGGFVNDANKDGVAFLGRRLSVPMLIELIDLLGKQQAAFFESLEPSAEAKWSVSWAGEETSASWFDVARELTERWHHQQQIRDAAGAPALYEPRYFEPVLDAFVLALPYTYRDVDAPAGTTIALRIDERTWFLVRDDDRWRLTTEPHEAITTIAMTGDTAWRLFTKGLKADEARSRTTVTGEVRYAEPIYTMLCIVA